MNAAAVWVCATVVLATVSCAANAPPAPAAPRTRAAEAARVLAPYLDGNWMLGASLAFVDARGVEYVNVGRLDTDGRTPPDENTVYEIGSLTKTFTGLLLAQLVEDGVVSLEQSVQSLLPSGVTVPSLGGRRMTLLDLATHYSGLPRDPSNLTKRNPNNPYADYTVQLLYDFLRQPLPAREPASAYEYSNVGVGLLGHVLSLRTGATFEDVLRGRICAPLGLEDTGVTLSDGQRGRMAPAHDADLEPIQNWDLGALEAAGGLRSTAHDLARYAEVLLGTKDSPLAVAVRDQILPRRRATDGNRTALGWGVKPDGTLSHSGLTGGYEAEMRLDPTSRAGVVLLTNTGLNVAAAELGDSLLDVARSRAPSAAVALPRETTMTDAALDEYVGEYAMPAGATLAVSRVRGRLLVVAPGERPIVLYPRAGGGFFARLLELTVRFEREHDGPVMVVTQSGGEQRMRRSTASKQAAREVLEPPER